MAATIFNATISPRLNAGYRIEGRAVHFHSTAGLHEMMLMTVKI
jgi:hypothetical protein